MTAGHGAAGIDPGGNRFEAVALDAAGLERWRQRITTPCAQGGDASGVRGTARLGHDLVTTP